MTPSPLPPPRDRSADPRGGAWALLRDGRWAVPPAAV
ncbi:MAG: hypothetical protein AVDCRST_MAG35-2790, partial [uncultured Quadrisphaera sp.]